MNEENLLKLAMDYQNKQEFDQAQEIFDKILQANPDNEDIYLRFIFDLLKYKQIEKAGICLNKIKDFKCQDINLIHSIGLLFGMNNLLDKAEICLKKAVEDPSNYDFLYNLGINFYKSEKFEEAIKAMLACLNIVPNNPDTLYNIGACFLFSKKLWRSNSTSKIFN